MHPSIPEPSPTTFPRARIAVLARVGLHAFSIFVVLHAIALVASAFQLAGFLLALSFLRSGQFVLAAIVASSIMHRAAIIALLSIVVAVLTFWPPNVTSLLAITSATLGGALVGFGLQALLKQTEYHRG